MLLTCQCVQHRCAACHVVTYCVCKSQPTVIAGAFTLVCASAVDTHLRCFNFETRESCRLALADQDSDTAQATKASPCALAYHAQDSRLAVALSNGNVQCFRHVDESRSAFPRQTSDVTGSDSLCLRNEEVCPCLTAGGMSLVPEHGHTGARHYGLHVAYAYASTCRLPSEAQDAVSEWEPLPRFRVATSAPNSLHFGPTSHILAVATAGHVHMCTESALKAVSRPPLLALQTSAQQVTVHHRKHGAVRRAAGLRLQGLDVSPSHLVMWNASTVEVFPLSAPDAARAAAFPISAQVTALALHGAQLLRCNAGSAGANAVLEAVDLQGTVQEKLELAKLAGKPEWLQVQDDCAAIVTSRLQARAMTVDSSGMREVASGQVQIQVHLAHWTVQPMCGVLCV